MGIPVNKRALIAQLADQGLSAQKIGDALNLTKNQVVGHCRRNRIQLKNGNKPFKKPPLVWEKPAASPPPPWGAPKRKPVAAIVPPEKRAVPMEIDPATVVIPPGTGTYSDDTGCLFLEGDVPPRGPLTIKRERNTGKRYLTPRTGEQVFGTAYESWADVPRCTEPRIEGRPYCRGHCLLSYQLDSLVKEANR
jgi:hypothetical protein